MTATVRDGWRAWFAAAMASALIALLVVHVPTSGRVINLDGLLVLITIMAATLPLIRRVITRTFDIFEPIVWACLMLLAIFAVRPLVMLASQNFTYQDTIDVSQGFGRAVLLGTLGTVSFVVAYEVWPHIRRRARTAPFLGRIDLDARRAAIIWLVGIGAALYLARLAIAGNPLTTLRTLAGGRSVASADTNSSAYLSDGPLLWASAATIIVISRRRGELLPRERVIAIVLVLGAVLAFALLGNRRLILPSAGTPVIAYYLVARRRPRWRNLAIILPVAFIFLATVPLARSLGARQNTQGGLVGIFQQALTQPFQPVSTFFTGADTAMVPDLALEVQTLRRPSEYYFGRATVGDVVLSPIPSALVPGKPETARNAFLIRIFGLPCQARSGSQCPDFSTVGTFYQDFWYFGAVVGMLALGVFSSTLWLRYREVDDNPTRLVLAASWIVSLPIIIRAGFMPSFQWWLEFAIPTCLALYLITARKATERSSVAQDQAWPRPFASGSS